MTVVSPAAQARWLLEPVKVEPEDQIEELREECMAMKKKDLIQKAQVWSLAASGAAASAAVPCAGRACSCDPYG